MKYRDIINYKALSKAVTGSERRITKAETAKKYEEDLLLLDDLINVVIERMRAKNG